MKRKTISKLLVALLTMFVGTLSLACCTQGGDSTGGGDNPPNSSVVDPGHSDSTKPETPDERVYYISTSYNKIDLLVGEEFALTFELRRGTEKIDDAIFAFESLNTAVATVDENGKIVSTGAGNTKIKIKATNYDNVETFVDVYSKADLTLELSETEVQVAKVAMFGETNIAELTYEVKWQQEIVPEAQVELLCSNENVSATLVNNKIVLTGREAGQSIVTAKYVKDGYSVETTVLVTIVKPTKKTDEMYLFSSGKKNTIDLSLMDATENFTAEECYSVSSGKTNFPIVSKSEDIVTISETEILGWQGEESSLTLEFTDYFVDITVKSYTHVIRTVQDFDNMKDFLVDTTKTSSTTDSGFCKIIEGYFILANDIDFNDWYEEYNVKSYSSPFAYKNVGNDWQPATHGWNATFDGQGYKIKNLCIGKSKDSWRNSLFGVINQKKGVIKNVAFVNGSMDETAGHRSGAFLANYVYGKLENVYIDVALPTNGTAYSNNVMAFKQMYDGKAHANVKNVTIIVRNQFDSTATNKDYIFSTGGNKNPLEVIKGKFIAIGGGVESQIVDGPADITTTAALKAINSNINAYVDIASAMQAGNQANGDVSISASAKEFIVSWKGTPVFQEVFYDILDSYDYSIDDAFIDCSLISELTASKVTSVSWRDSGEEIRFSVSGQKLNISGDSILNSANPTAATGEIEYIVVKSTEGNYILPLKIYTDVINTAEEFDEMKKFLVDASLEGCKIIQGYYVLGNDIDFSTDYADGYSSPFSYKDVGNNGQGYTHGWDATFDGQGYQIKNLKLSGSEKGPWEVSLFGTIPAGDSKKGTVGGKVMNVAFVNCSLSADLKNSAFLASKVYGTIENVYLDITVPATTIGNSAFVGITAGVGVESTNGSKTSISNVTVFVRNALGSNDHVIRGTVNGLQSIDGTFVVIGGGLESQIHAQYSTISALKAANSNIKAYINTAGAMDDANLTVCGSTKFVLANKKYTISWNNTVVYSEDVIYTLNESLYSIADATIDFSKIAGISAADITGISRNGVEVSYVLNGGIVTISGDAILNGKATAATGAVHMITISTERATYNLPLKVCTDVLYTASDFDDMKNFLTAAPSNANLKIIQGYYILANDIDFSTQYASGYASPFSYKDIGNNSGAYTHGWDATFDGNGHQIKNLKLVASEKGVWQVSLFGTIAGANSSKGTVGGKIRNVAFVNCSMASDLKNSAFLANSVYGTIENVYLDVMLSSANTNGNSAFVGMAVAEGVKSEDAKTSISNVTVFVRDALGTADHVIRGSVPGLQSIDGSFVVIGGGSESQIHSQYSTVTDLESANTNINAHSSIADASTDTALTNCGYTTFEKVANVYTISWNGKVVYTETLAA